MIKSSKIGDVALITSPIMQRSLLDNDAYQFSMQNAVLRHYPDVPVEYEFIDRKPRGKFNPLFFTRLLEEIDNLVEFKFNLDDLAALKKYCPYFGDDYLKFLLDFRLDRNDLIIDVVNGHLRINIKGLWQNVIMWEVPLMAIISELYFECCEKNWNHNEDQIAKLKKKVELLSYCKYIDFGTRRRRSFKNQSNIVEYLTPISNFLGTSNVFLARRFNCKAIGTMSHQWIMGVSVLEGLRHANRHAMRLWSELYRERPGFVLTDTFGSDAFFEDFDGHFARLFDGVRQDSGDPDIFAEKAIRHYQKLGIDPRSKTIVFSDGLTPEMANELERTWRNNINTLFGIGTNLTNDFENSDPLNIVIKLTKCNGIPVVKLSDCSSKATGNKDALRVARWTFYGQGLDS